MIDTANWLPKVMHKAGDSAMSGAYSENPDAIFVNLDLIGFIEPTPSADYPPHPFTRSREHPA